MSINVDFGIHITSDGAQAAAAAFSSIDTSASDLERSAVRAQKAQADLAVASQRAAAAQTAHAKAAADASTSQEKLIQLSTRNAQAQAAYAAATISARDAQAAQTRLMHSAGAATSLTAYQTQQLNFQLHDMAVQIASGQAPLTALIQQGSQLSGTFGGVSNTFRALGTVFTPVRLGLGGVAAVTAAAALAYREGKGEADAFAAALILSGNAAGRTVSQLNELAKAQDAVAGTRGQAAAILTRLAASGVVAAAQLGKATEAAIAFERAGAGSAEEVEKAIVSLGRAPLQALVRLNETQNFLTKSTYDQVAALEKQGKVAEAAAIAQGVYAEAMKSRSAELETRLGIIERGWRGIKDVAAEAWDAMLNVGRPDTLEEQLAKALKQLEAASVPRRGGNSEQAELRRVAIRQRIDDLRQEIYWQGEVAAAQQATSEAVKRHVELQKNQKATTQDVYGDLIASINEARIAAEADLDAGGRMSDARRLQIELIGRFVEKTDKLTDAQRRQVAISLGLAVAAREATDALKVQIDEAAALREGLRVAEDANKAFVKRREESTKRLTQAIDDEIIAVGNSVEAFQLEQSLAGADEKTRHTRIGLLQIEFDRRKKILELQRQAEKGEISQETLEAQKARINSIAVESGQIYADRFAYEFETRAANKIERDLIDAAIQGVSSIKRYLVDFFKRQVFTVFLQPVMGPVAGVLAAFSGSAAASGGAAGAAGQAAGAINMYSAGQSLYQGFASGFASVGNTAASAYSYGATLSGSTYGTGFATQQSAMLAAQEAGMGASAGGTAGLFGSVATVAAGVAAGIYGGRAVSGGYAAFGGSGNGTVNAGTAAGGIIGAVVGGPIGAAIGSAIGGLIGGVVNRAFGRRAPEVEGRSIEGSFAGGNFTGDTRTDIVEKGGWFRSDKRYSEMAAITGDLDKALDEGGKQLVELAEKYGAALGLPASRMSTVTEQFTVQLTDDADANSQAIAAALGKYSDALLGAFADDVEPLRRSGETVSQVIERVGGNLIQVNDLFKTLGLRLLDTSVAGGQAATELAELFGGLGNLGQAGGVYFAEFFTDSERAARGAQQVAEALGQVNIAMPTTRAEFRAQVEAQRELGDAGLKGLAVLLSLAGAFAELVPAVEAVEVATRSAAEIARERYDLETRLLQAQGDTATLRQRELDALDPANRALLEQIYILEDAEAATRALSGSLREVVAAASQAGIARGPGGQVTSETDLAAAVRLVTRADIEAAVASYSSVADRERAQANLDVGSQVFLNAMTNSIALGRIAASGQPNPAPEFRTGDDGRPRSDDEESKAMGRLTDSMNRLSDSIGDYLGSLLQGDLSTLSPEQKYLEAKSAFDAVAKQARAGDQAAVEQLRDRSQTFLQASRGYFGASAGYGINFDMVVAVLRDSQKLLERIASTGQADLLTNQQGLADIADTLQAGNDDARRTADRAELARQQTVP